ncbi:carotenoid oxygenase family protein [Herbaspirillum frisingense]|uniref:Carotenoid cleavage dioxygenase n=1 Tax=Herbaspirillum frisingense TaxID=92645 RepID=A0ABU1PK44_9BURK|nr:carotenoid oxygenase family protein [Herbaspirillum frisingense]MDR6585703.1 carotenoid cleavage dioxygenase [Herbaspirillum frisingense]
MNIRFSNNDFKSFEAPMRAEIELTGLEVVQGKVPKNLEGGFFRLIGDRKWPAFVDNDVFMLNEDGMASCFYFKDGKVDFRMRYVRTPRFVAEEKAGRALFGHYRNPFSDDPSVAGLSRGTANVTMLMHGGKLLALKEDSPAIELNPFTLETIGEYDWNGKVTAKAITAHPKIDARTGELVFFGYCAAGPATRDIAYYEADSEGNVTHETWFHAPYTCMVHDIMVTQNYVVFPITPLRHELEWIKRSEPAFKWDPHESVYLGVLPRKGRGDQIRWFKGPNQCHGHTVGAYDDGRYIYADNTFSKRSFFHFFPNVDGSQFKPTDAMPYMKRVVIDMECSDNSFVEQPLFEYPCELPRIDTRFETLPYSFATMNLLDVPGQERVGRGFQWIATMDVNGAKPSKILYAGDNCSIGEPQFVPAHDNAAEGDGYIMTVVGRHEQMRSELLILDASDINAPPVATVALPFRLRSTGHGYWYGGRQLRGETNFPGAW